MSEKLTTGEKVETAAFTTLIALTVDRGVRVRRAGGTASAVVMARLSSVLILLLLAAPVMGQRAPRKASTVTAFKKLTGYPQGRPGMVADHIVPLCAGGPDTVANLQWQERQPSYDKDSAERRLCAALSEYWPDYVVRHP